jgi:hypothetical protein
MTGGVDAISGKVPIPGGWTHISAGWKHTCGLQTDLLKMRINFLLCEGAKQWFSVTAGVNGCYYVDIIRDAK